MSNESTVDVVPVAGRIGAEIRGVRLSADLSPGVTSQIRDAWLKHKVLFFRNQQHLDEAAQESLTTIFGAVIGAAVLGISIMLLMRAQTEQDRRVGDIMLLSGLTSLAVAAAGAPPGGVGSPQAVLGFAVLAISAMLALRFTGRRLGPQTRRSRSR